ncbi:MAG: Chaperone protein DnaJ [Alphaproteobacteria bacterium ADurb.Bin438]|nr:MAG: Chaperone protein DnaJ [Alphaproteobacteria bacterium ADurb.Bin438]
MSNKRDYYEILGLNRGADASEIKRAYREMAKKYHPDMNPDNKEAEQKFKECSEAYEVLKDAQKKDAYDRYGHDAFSQGQGGFGGFGGADMSDFADIFADFFGGFGGGSSRSESRRSNARKGEDILESIDISLKDAFTGVERKIDIEKQAVCDECHGTGCKAGSSPETCSYCKGRGKVRVQQGFFMFEQVCPHCHGEGQVIKNPCTKCRGKGLIYNKKTLDIKIPQGIEDGMKMRVSGEGSAGIKGGPNGDLYILVNVKNHPIFNREAENLYCTIPISFTAATLGGKINLTLINDEKEDIKIPQGTQTDTTFTLKGKGMPKLKSGGARGDLFVKVKTTTPTKLNQKQKDLLKEFAKISGETVPENPNFIDKVKEFLDI